MGRNLHFAVVLIGLSIFFTLSLSARILSVTFMSSKSHKITYDKLLLELGARGHEVTVLAPIISPDLDGSRNIKQILTLSVEEAMCQLPNLYEMRAQNESFWEVPFKMYSKYEELCADTYDLPQVKTILTQKFDLVIVTPIFNECVAGFVHKLNTSSVLMIPVSAPSWITALFGNPSLPSVVPNMFTSLGNQMTFQERVVNVLVETVSRVLLAFYFKPRMESLYREKLNDASILSSDAIFRNASLILSNSHYSLNSPRPLTPDVIEVAGMHCRAPKPLPVDLEKFIGNSGSDGFIYFSMGSALKSARMPERYQRLFLGAFGRIKQRVLWKFETDSIPEKDIPKNVKLGPWFPQQDLLGHPKIKAFITHGGFGSRTEAVYHGVPFIGIPLFGDQDLNMRQSQEAGYAIPLDFSTLTEDAIVEAINRVISDRRFSEQAKLYSGILREQPEPPLERALFWIEHVLKYKGAAHLQSPGRHLTGFEFYSIDVILLIAAVVFSIFLGFWIIIKAIREILRICFSKKGKNSKLQKKKKQN